MIREEDGGREGGKRRDGVGKRTEIEMRLIMVERSESGCVLISRSHLYWNIQSVNISRRLHRSLAIGSRAYTFFLFSVAFRSDLLVCSHMISFCLLYPQFPSLHFFLESLKTAAGKLKDRGMYAEYTFSPV